MTTTHEPTYVTAMRRRHRALDTAVLNAVRDRGPIFVNGLIATLGKDHPTIVMSLRRLGVAGLVRSEIAPPPNQRWQQWRAVEREARE